MSKEKKFYLNDKQREFLSSHANIVMFLAGRGTGKTFTIGEAKFNCLARMPRGKTFLSSSTYAQILTKSIPEMQSNWEQHGLIEDVHYVIGKRPPKQFIKPFKPPKKFQNVITFWNGYTIELLSMDRPDLARGGSYDGGDIDEAALVKKEAFTKVIVPSVRGNRQYFHKQYVHGQIRLYSSVAWKPSGQWIHEFEEKAKLFPDDFGFVEACTMDNVAVLGPEYIERMKKTLPWLEYQIEVLNRRVMKIPDGFYHKFDPEVHCVSNTYNYDDGPTGIMVKGSKDVDKHAPIDFSLDFGGRINCGLAIQKQGNNTMNFLKEFYVLNDQKLRELVAQFCEHFKDQKIKHVRLYGEPRGKDRQPDGDPFYTRMVRYFDELNWTCEISAVATAEDHLTRHNLITEIFEEQDQQLPKVRINENNCKNFILVLQTTPVKDDFKKDKTKERDPNFPQEQAPHLSDCFDNYITQKFPHLLNGDTSFWLGNQVGFM